MEPKFQTSFIPKKQIGGDSDRVTVREGVNIFSLASTIIGLFTALLFGGLYGYNTLLLRQIVQADQDVNSAREAIQPEEIKKLLDDNSRITASISLLENHLATSNLLYLLGDTAVKKLRFNDFSYVNKNGSPSITIGGEVQTFNALASQQEALASNELIKNLHFGDLTLGDLGSVRFKFSARLDPSLVSYKKVIENNNTEQ